MEYSQEDLEAMASQISLYEYAGQTVDFTRHVGQIHFCICPFHKEKTGSLAVYEDENTFHCYGCHAHGNIYTWIQKIEHLSFRDAVQKVANLTNFIPTEHKTLSSLVIYKQLAKHQKSDTKIERSFLDFEKDYVQKYSDVLPQEWIDEGIPEAELMKYEIRTDNENSRIVYPVYDRDFHFIGVKGRTRFENHKEFGIPKYMNYYSLQTVDFFTGMKQAIQFIQDSGKIIIVEGIKSVMKLDSYGYCNVVSAETSRINEAQVALLIQLGVKEVTVAFDKDVKLSSIKKNVEMLRRYTKVYAVIDRKGLLGEKESPPDRGKEVWEKLYEGRVRI